MLQHTHLVPDHHSYRLLTADEPYCRAPRCEQSSPGSSSARSSTLHHICGVALQPRSADRPDLLQLGILLPHTVENMQSVEMVDASQDSVIVIKADVVPTPRSARKERGYGRKGKVESRHATLRAALFSRLRRPSPDRLQSLPPQSRVPSPPPPQADTVVPHLPMAQAQ